MSILNLYELIECKEWLMRATLIKNERYEIIGMLEIHISVE